MKPEPPLADPTRLTARRLAVDGGEAVPTGTGWRRPAVLLALMAVAMQLAFASWSALQYNFAYEALNFSSFEIGIQQSIREVPGFLAFAAVFFLFVFREQVFAYVSLALLAVGTAATGYFPSAWGFYVTTFVGSVGFHYYETMAQSLTLQWLKKDVAPQIMGRILGAAGGAQLVAYALIFGAGAYLELAWTTLFLLAGGLSLALLVFMASAFPVFPETQPQRKQLILRRRYWLYYALTFMSGARRQIFLVFASWMMVERFGYAFKDVAALFFVNAAVLMVIGPLIGKLIARIGERSALLLEYVGLAGVFATYAFVTDPNLAIALYVIDHALFAMAIAMKTYFQKIADPGDMAGTAGVAFTINHVAAVFIPVLFGALWLYSPAAVFLSGAAMALVSFGLATLVPHAPRPGNETLWRRGSTAETKPA